MNVKIMSPYMKILIVCPLIIFYSLLFFDKNRVIFLTKEDGFVEYFGALSFLACSIVFLIIYFNSSIYLNIGSIKIKRNIFYLVLGLIFLLGFLEEISWGQRILGYDTPAIVKKYNQQAEFNIHNLKWFHGLDASGKPKNFYGKFFNIDRIFSFFWFGFCFIIPILYRINSKFADLTKTYFIPIVPIFIGTLFLLNYIASRCLEFYLVDLASQITEIKEANIAYLFLVFSLLELKE